MINQAALAMEYGASCEDIVRVYHAHLVNNRFSNLVEYNSNVIFQILFDNLKFLIE